MVGGKEEVRLTRIVGWSGLEEEESRRMRWVLGRFVLWRGFWKGWDEVLDLEVRVSWDWVSWARGLDGVEGAFAQ